MSLATDKAALRKAAAAARAEAAARARPGAAGILSDVLAGHRGVPLSGYHPIRSEIDPLPAMAEAAAWGPVGLPVIAGKDRPLTFRAWTPDCAMQDGPYGAQIPADPTPVIPQILIVPLLAFDRSGARLGYGGGFYDRTLAALRARGPALAIGFAFAAQQLEAVPTEPTDVLLDMIVTETGVIDICR